MADDAEEMLQGAAVLAARIMATAAQPNTHALRVQQLLGLAELNATTAPVDVSTIVNSASPPGNAALIGFDTAEKPRYRSPPCSAC